MNKLEEENFLKYTFQKYNFEATLSTILIWKVHFIKKGQGTLYEGSQKCLATDIRARWDWPSGPKFKIKTRPVSFG